MLCLLPLCLAWVLGYIKIQGDTYNFRALLCYLRILLAWFCLDFLLCVTCSLTLKITREFLYKLIGWQKGLSSRVFWTNVLKISNPKLEPIRDLLAKLDILRNCSTINHKFTWEKSIRTFLTFNFYEWKHEVEHDFFEGLSSRVFLKFSRQRPNLTKLLRQ